MNFTIETLNQWGGIFLTSAWPMFSQSSLLITTLFAMDLLFRRKLRVSVRYALWLVVLVKLCVPPTLALPTSPAWWLHKTPPPVVAKSLAHYTVTYDNGPLPEIPQTPLPAIIPPRLVLTNAAWLLIVSAASSLVLLLWLLVRWWQIIRLVRRAATSERLTIISDEAQRFIGMKSKVRVKVTTNSMSPAVCGLFRPAILIPQSLAENFSDEQLRAVLLHELIHLRRHDVWVNFAQALLQVVYWWHPLVWLANARIRRVREEAVDDAVMLALRDEAESYAPTLLEVAKLALNRPLVGLGLVGILESRSALRQRIERLVDFHPPLRAGLTLVSLLGILAFTAVAVPMGDGPAPAEKQTVSAPAITTPSADSQNWNPLSVLIASSIYQVRAADFEKFIAGLKLNPSSPGGDPWWSASPEKFRQLAENLKLSGFDPIHSPRIQTGNGQTAEMYIGGDMNSITLNCTPLVVGGLVALTIHGKVIDTIAQASVTNQFSAKTTAENHGGIVLRVEKLNGFAESNLVLVTGVQVVTNVSTSRHQQGFAPVSLTNVPGILSDPNFRVVIKALEQRNGSETLTEPEVTTTSGRGANRIRTDNLSAPVFHPASESSNQINMPFKLDHPIHHDELMEKLRAAGVNNTTTVLYYEDHGVLVARGIEEQLALVNRLVRKLNGYSAKEIEASDEYFPSQFYKLEFENSKTAITTNLFNRHFKVGTDTFADALRKVTGMQTDDVSIMAKSFFRALGVNLQLPGKSVFYSRGNGSLFVQATTSDLDTIEEALGVFITAAPQIHIRAWFVEVPMGFMSVPMGTALGGFQKYEGTSNFNAQVTGILNATNAKAVLHSLESRKDVEIIAEPEVITSGGRQTQMRATRFITVVTNYAILESRTNGAVSIVPQTSQIEIGPVLDVVPYALSDGYTIHLTLTPSLIEFLGYDTPPTNAIEHINDFGDHLPVMPVILPSFRIHQAFATLNLWDGQTVVLGSLPEKHVVAGKEVDDKSKRSDKDLVVFITATLVDPAGNRIHSDEGMPFTQKGIPPQPK